MSWADFYDRYNSWDESTLMQHISQLTDFGPSEEVVDVANNFESRELVSKFIRKASDAGVRFLPEEIDELDLAGTDKETLELLIDRALAGGDAFSFDIIFNLELAVSMECLSKMLTDSVKNGMTYTSEEIQDLYGYVEDDALIEAVKASGTKYTKKDILEMVGIIDNDLLERMDKELGTGVFAEEYDD